MNDDPRLLPFDLGSGDDAVLLIHGFTGTPYETRYLGEKLALRGYRVHGVRLTGHGLDPLDLERATAEDWIRDVRAGFQALSGFRRVFVAGLSMGALLAVALAAEKPRGVAALALLAPALRFQWSVRLYLRLFRSELLRHWIRFVPKGASAVLDATERRNNPSISRVPTQGAVQLSRMVDIAEESLPRVRAPALVVISAHDPTVSPRSASLIAERLGSRPVRVLVVRRSLHVLTIDRDRDEVAAAVAGFFDEVRVETPPPDLRSAPLSP